MLEQRERDVLGLALLAAGIFMGFVLYGGWNGGRAGHGLAVALGWMLGRARVLAPVALAAGGVALLARPMLPAVRPLRSGALCVFASVTLALAAGTLGLSSGPGGRGSAWGSAFLQAHGGVVGEALYQPAHRLVQSVGVEILVVHQDIESNGRPPPPLFAAVKLLLEHGFHRAHRNSHCQSPRRHRNPEMSGRRFRPLSHTIFTSGLRRHRSNR